MAQVLIGIVGPCAAGKTTLTTGLTNLGYKVKHIAQEHSYVKDMWKRITNPDVLIYLDVSYPETLKRRKLDWTIEEYNEQIRRLENARNSADIYINTDSLTPQQVMSKVIEDVNHIM